MSAFAPNPSQQRVMACRDQLCVIAGAGSGKTGTLVATVLERLTEAMNAARPLSVANLLALTFTEKAAAELRLRLGLAFQEKARAHPEEAPFWRKEAARLDRADIGTIHGYALKLVRENALSLGLPAALNVENGKLFLDRDLNHIFTDWLDEGDPDLLWLLDKIPAARFPEILAASVIPFNSWGLGRLSAELDSPEPSEHDLGDFRALVKSALEVVENGDLNKSKPYYEKVRAAMLALNEDAGRPFGEIRGDWGACIARWQGLIKESGDWFSKRGRPKKKELEAAVQELKARYDAFISGPVKERILRLAHQLPGRLNDLKRQRGAIDFDDILILARRLLAQNPGVRQREAERRRLILIDEFQDTNRLQADLLAWLLLDPEDGRASESHELWGRLPWAELAPRLNVFGDLKQSIYRFRGAEVEVMAGLREALAGGHGAVLALDSNYRSQGPLVEFFNKLFQDRLGAAAFTEHDRQSQTRPALYEGPQAILLIPGEEIPGRADQRAALQAETLKRYLGDLFSGKAGVKVADGRGNGRPPGPGDVAILFRKKRRALIFKETLKSAWPCQTAFGDSPFSYAEVKALLAAFKYLGGLDEDISLAGVLRSPLGPVSDPGLLTLARPAGERSVRLSEYFGGSRPWPELSPADLEILGELHTLLAKLRPLMGRVPPVEILEKIVEERRLIPSALLEPDGEERARAITAFLAASRALGRGGGDQPLGAAEELAALADNWENLRRDGDDQLNPSAIKLMTVHGSKGLEFPVVIIAEADDAPRAASPPVVISRQGQLAIRFTDDSGRSVQAADYRRLREEEEARAREEDGRLLYVAATRAQDHLVFLGWPKKNKARAGAKVSWFETVVNCEAVAEEVGRVQYDEAAPGPAAAPGEAPKITAAPETARWPLDLLPPLEPRGHTLAVTAFSLLLVSPKTFYDEWHLGLERGFSWRPGCGEDFFQIGGPEIQAETNGPGRNLSAAEAGSLFHAVLEKIDLEDPRPLASLLREAELMRLAPSEGEIKSLAASLETFLGGPAGRLWRESRQLGLAEYRELPFRLSIPGPKSGDVLHVGGRIDLFHQTPDGGGRIVDYKFTRFRPGPELTAYEIQLRAYGQALAAAGFPGPLSAALYFAGGRKPCIHEVELARPDPLAPHLARLHELWPVLAATRPLRPNRPGSLPPFNE